MRVTLLNRDGTLYRMHEITNAGEPPVAILDRSPWRFFVRDTDSHVIKSDGTEDYRYTHVEGHIIPKQSGSVPVGGSNDMPDMPDMGDI